MLSYSKIKTVKNGDKELRNDIHFQFTYSPANINDSLGKIIFESFRFFIRNFKPSMLLNDVHQELKKFQSNIYIFQ